MPAPDAGALELIGEPSIETPMMETVAPSILDRLYLVGSASVEPPLHEEGRPASDGLLLANPEAANPPAMLDLTSVASAEPSPKDRALPNGRDGAVPQDMALVERAPPEPAALSCSDEPDLVGIASVEPLLPEDAPPSTHGGPNLEGIASVGPTLSDRLTHPEAEASPATPTPPAMMSTVQVYSRRRKSNSAARRPDPPPLSSPAAEQMTPQQRFINRISKAVGTLLPAPKINKRRAKNPPPGSLPRRSRRLAGLGAEPVQPAVPRAKKTILCSLGLAASQERLPPEVLEAYAKLFQQPLSELHIKALASLFGWEPLADVACEALA